MNSRDYNIGVAAMAGSGVFFALMSGLIRYASDVNSFTMALFRFTVGIALLGTAAMTGKIQLTFFRSRLLFLRGLIGGTGTVIFYLSIVKVGLAKGTVITYTYPIFAAIGGALFLGERIPLRKWLAIGVAMGGLYLTVAANGSFDGHLGFYEVLAIIGAVMAGVVVVIVKKLRETESAYSIFMAQCAVGFWIVLIPASTSTSEIGLSGAVVLTAAALMAAAGQLLMTYGYRHVPVSTGSLLTMLTPVINVVVGLSLFNESISWVSGAGIAIVIGACAWVATRR